MSNNNTEDDVTDHEYEKVDVNENDTETETETESVSNNNEGKDTESRREAWIAYQEQLRIKKEEHIAKTKEHYIEVLQGQTTWSYEEAKTKLEENNYNVQACVRIFMGLPALKENNNTSNKNNTTINQSIYTQIRGVMDNASHRYEKKKQMEEKMQAMREMYAQKQSNTNNTNT